MSEHDWDRLYRHVQRIRRPRRWPENLMWAAMAITAGGAFSFVGWIVSSSTLDSSVQAKIMWEGWAFAAVAIAAGVIAVVCFAANRGASDELVRDKDDILEDIEKLHPPLSFKG